MYSQNLRVTGLPCRFKNSNFVQAFAMFATSANDDMLLCDRFRLVRFGTFLPRLFASIDSRIFPEQFRQLNRNSRGKFSNRDNRLSVKSIVSKASRVPPKCSIAGIANPRKTNSRSPSGFVLCSDEFSNSAESLMV